MVVPCLSTSTEIVTSVIVVDMACVVSNGFVGRRACERFDQGVQCP